MNVHKNTSGWDLRGSKGERERGGLERKVGRDTASKKKAELAEKESNTPDNRGQEPLTALGGRLEKVWSNT